MSACGHTTNSPPRSPNLITLLLIRLLLVTLLTGALLGWLGRILWQGLRSGKMRHTDSRRYFDWLYHAKLDYLAAELLTDDVRCFLPAAFHCQQCIEKALKGYLLFKKRRLLDGHNLTWLCKQAVMMDKTFLQWLGKSAKLNRYYIETRYPADIPMDVDTETIGELMASTAEMLDFICEQIRFDFNSYHKR